MQAGPVTDAQWAAQRVAALPRRWQGRILRAWERARGRRAHGHWTAESEAHRGANLELLELTKALQGVRLDLDATDREICDRADTQAARCIELAAVYHQAEDLHAAMVRLCQGHGIDAPDVREDKAGRPDLKPAMARMTCPLWWRRQLRRMHAKEVEGAAIRLGLVNRRADPYVSAESLARRQQQNQRNAAAMEATIARNELGQEFTIAELAATGTANKAIRRAELMTRIAGFERIARDLDHAGLFLTITCPSRMHRWRTVAAGQVIENPRFDGTNPREAQRYLARLWARIRASLKRQDVGLYGFRIAEPNHDGTPHWHLLVFHRPADFARLTATVRRYALQDSPDEPGAARHRVDLKPIDWSRGTAAGYIAKYVAKNIDGYKVEKDLLGNDALETAARVEAWASTWGIRQFQQVGGPPVTVWRELRRVAEVPEGAPEHLREAHRAVNRTATFEGRENASVAWDHYCRAQGGVFVGRRYRIRIEKADREGVGRYGEPLQPVPVGVWTEGTELYRIGQLKAERAVIWSVESTRHEWVIVSRMGRGARVASEGPQAPWTRVNNCTEGGRDAHGSDEGEARSGGAGAGNLEQGTRPRPGGGWGLRGAASGRGGRHRA